MNSGLIISSIALGISLTVSTIKLIDWLVHRHGERPLLVEKQDDEARDRADGEEEQQPSAHANNGTRISAWRGHADCADHAQLARDPLVAKVPTDLDRGQPA